MFHVKQLGGNFMTSKEIQDYVWQWLIAKGLNEKATAGIMGNISQESSWDDQEIEAGIGIGFGLCQWSYTRRTQLEAYGTDLEHQLNFLWSEMTGDDLSTTGAELQWINKNGYTYSDFSAGNYSPSDSASAFCWCWERPNAGEANESFRQSEAENFYNTYKGTTGGGSSTDNSIAVENAVKWMIDIANDDSHGYDQDNRWGPDYDCSSFVISGYEQAGIQLKENGASYTGDMKNACIACGFKEIDWGNDSSKLVRGDIILNEVHHVCCYIGNGQIVQASANEFGQATGGQTGDQTGKEICIRDYYVYSSGWDCVLRLGNGAITPPSPKEGEVWQKILKTPYNVKQLTDDETTFIKTLSFDEVVHMKFTFNHNKRQIGQNYLANKLTFDNLGYKIKDVRNDGYIILSYGGNECQKYVNPKYIKA
jgi:cell wall-associated NlpC family hydrolase